MKPKISTTANDSNFNFDENILPEPEFESAQDIEKPEPTQLESSNDILPNPSASDDLSILGDEIPNA